MKINPIFIDCQNLMHKARHSTGDLSFEDQKVGVVFGFLRDLLHLKEKWPDSTLVMCFDSKKSYRKEVFGNYKIERYIKETDEEKEKRINDYDQFNQIRKDVLPKLGFENIFLQMGYEGDDLIAKGINDYIELMSGDIDISTPIIVSSDRDFYVFLNKANQYKIKDKKIYKNKDFLKEFETKPENWTMLKAIAGKQGEIDGVKGVGIKFAMKYINGELTKGKKYESIIENKALIERNLKLSALPFEKGRRPIKPLKISYDNEMKKIDFIDVFEEFGFYGFLKQDYFRKWTSAFNLKR